MSKPYSSKEDQILAAAKPLFLRYGPRKTTIDDIAQAASLGKGTIYLYFTSKEHIFMSCMRRDMDAFLERVSGALDSTETVKKQLAAYVRERCCFMEEIRSYGASHESLREVHAMPEMTAFCREYFQREADLLRQIVILGVENGELQVHDTNLAVTMIAASVHGVVAFDMFWSIQAPTMTLDERVEALVGLLVNGLTGNAVSGDRAALSRPERAAGKVARSGMTEERKSDDA